MGSLGSQGRLGRLGKAQSDDYTRYTYYPYYPYYTYSPQPDASAALSMTNLRPVLVTRSYTTHRPTELRVLKIIPAMFIWLFLVGYGSQRVHIVHDVILSGAQAQPKDPVIKDEHTHYPYYTYSPRADASAALSMTNRRPVFVSRPYTTHRPTLLRV